MNKSFGLIGASTVFFATTMIGGATLSHCSAAQQAAEGALVQKIGQAGVDGLSCVESIMMAGTTEDVGQILSACTQFGVDVYDVIAIGKSLVNSLNQLNDAGVADAAPSAPDGGAMSPFVAVSPVQTVQIAHINRILTNANTYALSLKKPK